MNWTDVARVEDFPPGSHRLVDVDGVAVAVFNLDGSYHAIEDVCSHDGGDLSSGDVESDQVVCPRHGAHFSLRTGEALSPPAYEAIPTFPVRVEDGMVQVRDDRWD